MEIHSIKDLNDSYVISLLEQGLSKVEEPTLKENYHPANKNNNANLFYLLDNKRFAVGNYYVMETDDGEYAGSAGWNKYTDDTALVFVRAYIPKKYRVQYLMAKNLMPKILEETSKFNRLWITCNEYNKAIYKGLIQLSNNKPAGLSSPWPEQYACFKPVGIKTVNYVDQYIAEYKRSAI